jgi:hypothetical protein
VGIDYSAVHVAWVRACRRSHTLQVKAMIILGSMWPRVEGSPTGERSVPSSCHAPRTTVRTATRLSQGGSRVRLHGGGAWGSSRSLCSSCSSSPPVAWKETPNRVSIEAISCLLGPTPVAFTLSVSSATASSKVALFEVHRARAEAKRSRCVGHCLWHCGKPFPLAGRTNAERRRKRITDQEATAVGEAVRDPGVPRVARAFSEK